MDYQLKQISEDSEGNPVAYVALTVGTATKTVCLPAGDKEAFKAALSKKAAQVQAALETRAAVEKNVTGAINELKAAGA